MNKCTILGGLTAFIALAGLILPVASATPPATPIEHHLFLHLMTPEDGGTYTIVVVDRPDAYPASEADEPDEASPDETEPDMVPEEPPVPPPTETELEVLLEAALSEPAEAAEEPALLIMEDDLAATPPLPEADTSLVLEDEKKGTPLGLLLFIFVLAIFLGFELISKVPSQLHTPLMSGSNAISGITIVGALAAAGLGMGGPFGTLLGVLAVTFATINVVGGYMVTNRMLGMFKKKDGGTP